MQKKNFGVDLDNVIFNWTDSFRKFLRLHFNYTADFPAPTKFNFWEEWGFSKEHFLFLFDQYVLANGFLQGGIYENSVETIKELQKEFNVVFVTSRGNCSSNGEISKVASIAKQDTIT
jgi:hypothetical protein